MIPLRYSSIDCTTFVSMKLAIKAMYLRDIFLFVSNLLLLENLIFHLCKFSTKIVLLLQKFQNYTVARDTFLSHLGSILWGSMRHVIAPSVADGRFHFYEQISYQLFFITQDVLFLILFL